MASDESPTTIFAPATALGRAAIAVLRISGPHAGAALQALAGDLPPPRRATRRRLTTANGEALDDALVLWFPGPASYSGEDAAELHLHGGRAVVAAVLEALAALPGLRPAEPGEFTRRAFENGKLDLTAIEGLADLVAAESEAQRRQALRQLDGELGALYDSWRESLLHALAMMEAAIDFSDEDLPDDLVSSVHHDIRSVLQGLILHLDDNHRGERLREGLFVAIIGAPNVGKSSLLNRLARREAAIVSHHAGTTRDVVEVHMDIAGLPVILADTAGLRARVEGAGGAGKDLDEVEQEGIARTLARAAAADLKIAVFDAAAWPRTDERTRELVDKDTMVIVNKIDLVNDINDIELGENSIAGAGKTVMDRTVWPLSCRDGTGLEGFLEALEAALTARLVPGLSVVLTRARHRAALEDCVAALERFLAARDEALTAPELATEDLRLAARALGRITGRVDVEDVLDVIFAEFCIGK